MTLFEIHSTPKNICIKAGLLQVENQKKKKKIAIHRGLFVK